MLNTSFPRSLKPYTPIFLSSALSHLQSLAPFFSQYYLSPSSPPIPTSTEDDSVIDLTHLSCPILDFVGSSVKLGYARDWLKGDNLTSLIGAIAWWVQITTEDVSCIFHCPQGLPNVFNCLLSVGGVLGKQRERICSSRVWRISTVQRSNCGLWPAFRKPIVIISTEMSIG